MSIGKQIAAHRKQLNITQDMLAQQLDVTNQAVSKWESDLCCPDIMLLPRLADIFGCSIDALFERDDAPTNINALPWPEDDTLRIVVYHGHSLIGSSDAVKEITFQYEGPALNVDCALNLMCLDVSGDVHASGSVTCDDINGNIHAGGNVTCDCVDGDVRAGGNITCDEICGSASAGGSIYCDEINSDNSQQNTVHIHQQTSPSNQKRNAFSFIFRKK